MREYQPFPISNFRTGFDEAVEPWLLPRDAYQVMINAHLYRGVLERIEGYNLFAKFSDRTIISLGTPNGVTRTFTGTLAHLPTTTNFFAYGTIVVATSAETFSYMGDASSTVVNLVGSAGGTGTVNISTGAYSITFNTAPPTNTYSSIFLIYDSAPTSLTAIMGIKQYFTVNGSQDVLVFDQRRLGKIIGISGIIAQAAGANNAVSELSHDYYQTAIFTGDGVTVTFTGTLSGTPFVPNTLRWTEYTSTGALPASPRTITDNGVGELIGTGVTSGSINYVTGAYTITFATAPASGDYFDSTIGIYGDLFTGDIFNFFSLYNYQDKAFFSNNVDPIMYYDGTTVHYLNTNVTVKPVVAMSGVPTFDILTCLHVFVNRDFLLLINVNFQGVLAVSTIFRSVPLNPLNFSGNNSGSTLAPTSEPIRAIGFINSDLIVRFASSERAYRWTGDINTPFRFDSRNSIWDCDAPYSAINYDTWFSSIGRPAIVGSYASDSTNVQRVDEIIPDFTDSTRLSGQVPVPFLNQESIITCYGERFDDIKEGWLCYNSSPDAESNITASDNVLSYNYLDDTYAVYAFPLSCLGFGRVTNVPTWGSTYETWEEDSDTWGSYYNQLNSLLDLGGDQFDNVFELNSGNLLTIPGDSTATLSPVLMNVISKNFNPFIEEGQLARLGYIDLFVSANNDSVLRVQFFLNDQLYIDSSGNPAGFYQESILTFNTQDAMTPPTGFPPKYQTKVWKRIYVGSVAKSHTIRFYQNIADFATTDDQPIYIHAMVLYMKPAGRIFN
jgi:hypothetical protein